MPGSTKWLTLDAIYRRRGQVLAPIGNTNLFGEILISRVENQLLVDTASRKRAVENEAFAELRDVLRDAIGTKVTLPLAREIATAPSKRREPTEHHCSEIRCC